MMARSILPSPDGRPSKFPLVAPFTFVLLLFILHLVSSAPTPQRGISRTHKDIKNDGGFYIGQLSSLVFFSSIF